MRVIKTKGIYDLAPVGTRSNWYWGEDCISGDLYEAEEIYKLNEFIKKNRLVMVRFPEGKLIEPIILEEGQYLGKPYIYNEEVYVVVVDFPKQEINLISFNPDEVL